MTDHNPAHAVPVPHRLPASLEKKMLMIASYVAAEHQRPGSGDDQLFEILHFDYYRIPPLEIAQLAVERSRRQRLGKEISFSSLIREKINARQTTLFDPPVYERLATAMAGLDKLITAGKEASPTDIYTILPVGYGNRDSLLPVTETQPAGSLHPAKPRVPKLDDGFIKTLLQPFVLHVTALNNYLQCPLKFFYETLIRAPYARSDAAEFGCAVHTALQSYFERMQQDPAQEFPALDAILDAFNTYMDRRKNSFFLFDFDERLLHGRQILRGYCEKNMLTWNKIVAIERNISNVVVSGVPVKGFIDKLEFNGRDVKIVDYKTGNLQRALGQVQPPHDALPNGGNYWRQAVFYKMLVDNYPGKAWNVLGVTFDFIEPDLHNEWHTIDIPVGPADIETVTQQIVATWNSIQSGDFYTGCGLPACHWCNFAREL